MRLFSSKRGTVYFASRHQCRPYATSSFGEMPCVQQIRSLAARAAINCILVNVKPNVAE
jgi:hypothetical protein